VNAIAVSYSKFRFLKLRFIYIPQCPTTTSGEVVLSTGYDYLDPAPASVNNAQMSYGSVTSPLWAGAAGSCLLGIERRPIPDEAVVVDFDVNRFGYARGPAYYRYMTLAGFGALSPSDRNVYSPCYLDVSTVGGPAVGITAGTIFVEYEIELVEPISGVLNG